MFKMFNHLNQHKEKSLKGFVSHLGRNWFVGTVKFIGALQNFMHGATGGELVSVPIAEDSIESIFAMKKKILRSDQKSAAKALAASNINIIEAITVKSDKRMEAMKSRHNAELIAIDAKKEKALKATLQVDDSEALPNSSKGVKTSHTSSNEAGEKSTKGKLTVENSDAPPPVDEDKVDILDLNNKVQSPILNVG